MGPVEAGADGEEVQGGLQAGLGPDASWVGGGLGWESHQVAMDGVGHGEGAPTSGQFGCDRQAVHSCCLSPPL